MPEWLDNMSSVKLGRFRSPLEASCMSSHTEEFWYNETVCLGITNIFYLLGCSNSVMANELGSQTISSEFDSQQVHSLFL